MDGLRLTEDQTELLRRFRERNPSALEEDEVKIFLQRWLESDGWHVDVKWGKTVGIDIDATKGAARWIIERRAGQAAARSNKETTSYKRYVKSCRRMTISDAKYSLAFPDIPRYRGLWERFPKIAKHRTGISCLFLDERGGSAALSFGKTRGTRSRSSEHLVPPIKRR